MIPQRPRGACWQQNTDDWYVKENGRAMAICRSCPASLECCLYADRMNEEFGIWGGINRSASPSRQHVQRNEMLMIWNAAGLDVRPAMRPLPPITGAHGTAHTYAKGCRCTPCCDARKEDNVRRRNAYYARKGRVM